MTLPGTVGPVHQVDRVVTIVANDVGGNGGMEVQLAALITRLLERGIDVEVVSRTLDLPPHPNLRWRRVPGVARPFPLAYPSFMVAASLMLMRRRAGVLHTTGAIVLNRADVCTVHYLHNGETGSVARVRFATRLYLINAALARVMSRVFERFIFSSPTLSGRLIAVSEALEAEIRGQFPGRAGSVRLIRNGVDTQRFQPDARSRREVREALGLGEDVLLALFVGSEWAGKGVAIAVEALTLTPWWELAVVGRGDTRGLRRRAQDLGVEPRLHIVGEVGDPERYYAAADAFVLPSAYETFSLAAFEAAASGVPVVSTRVGAVEEILSAGGGICVERDAAAVATALNHIGAHRDEARGMSARARERALSFGWDAVAEEYVSLYSESSWGRQRANARRGAP